MQKKANNRSFGLLFSIIFLIISLWPLLNSEAYRLWALIISLIFLFLGVIDSQVLSPFKSAWIKLGEFLGKVIAPIVMFLVFFTILTPTGIILRLFGKDLIKIKKDKTCKSYWVDRKNISSMNRQF